MNAVETLAYARQRVKDGDLLADFRNFTYEITKNTLGWGEPADIRYDMADWLQNPPVSQDGIARCQTQALRGFGKSVTVASMVAFLWKLNQRLRISVVCSGQTKATEISDFTKQLLDGTPCLQHLVPDFGAALGGMQSGKARLKREKNTTQAWDIAGAGPGKDPSLAAYPIFGGFTGSHPDVLIVDDIEIPENSMTALKRERLLNKMREFESLIQEGGIIIVLGTPQTQESVYNELEKMGYPIRKWPAEAPDPTNADSCRNVSPWILQRLQDGTIKPGDPVYPERFPEERLAEKRAKGMAYYRLQYLLDTTMSDAQLYPLKLRDLIVWDAAPDMGPAKIAWGTASPLDIDHPGFNGDRLHGPAYVSPEFMPWTGGLMWIDPAGGGGDSVAYAIVKALNGQLFVLDAGVLAVGKGVLGTSEEVMLRLAQLCRDWHVNRICVESNWGGSKDDSAYARLLQPVVGRVCGAVSIEPKWSTGQKELRICDTLEPLMLSRRLVISQSAARCEPLMYQITHVTRQRGSLLNDDAVEALAMACREFLDQVMQDPTKIEEDERERLAIEYAETYRREFLKANPIFESKRSRKGLNTPRRYR